MNNYQFGGIMSQAREYPYGYQSWEPDGGAVLLWNGDGTPLMRENTRSIPKKEVIYVKGGVPVLGMTKEIWKQTYPDKAVPK